MTSTWLHITHAGRTAEHIVFILCGDVLPSWAVVSSQAFRTSLYLQAQRAQSPSPGKHQGKDVVQTRLVLEHSSLVGMVMLAKIPPVTRVFILAVTGV